MQQISVYIAEDHASIRQLYEYAFDRREYDVTGFESAELLLAAIKTGGVPDIIIMDLMLPGMDGMAAMEALKQNPSTASIPVIIVSAIGAEGTKVRGFNSGADDYIEKPFGVLELVARVKRLLRNRHNDFPEEILECGHVTIDVSRHSVSACGKDIQLTPKEFDILKLLVKKQGSVVLRDTIFDTVWGENYFTETRTLDIHINRIREKLNIACGNGYIKTVRGVGYTIDCNLPPN